MTGQHTIDGHSAATATVSGRLPGLTPLVESALQSDPAGASSSAPSPVWLIPLGMGPQFHAVDAALDPGAPTPRGLTDPVRWPTVETSAACTFTGRFRRGGFLHDGLPRCARCCQVTATPAGYGPPPAPTSR